jgi:hypothetical protein
MLSAGLAIGLAAATPYQPGTRPQPLEVDARVLAAITVEGRVSGPYRLGRYVGGTVKHSGRSDPDRWSGWHVFPTAPEVVNSLDRRWIELASGGAPNTTVVVIDLGQEADSVLVFPSIDHGPMTPAPYEALEFTVWGSHTSDYGSFPGGWRRAQPIKLFRDGWIDVGATEESDDFVSQWSFMNDLRYRYVAVYADRSIRFLPEPQSSPGNPYNDCRDLGVWCSGDAEIDAVGAFIGAFSSPAPPTKTPAPEQETMTPGTPEPTAHIETPTATLGSTLAAPESATPTALAPVATGTPAGPPGCVCRVAIERVPRSVIEDAFRNPTRYMGWLQPRNPSLPPGRDNPLRRCLSLLNPNVDYHSVWNPPVWRAGCP